MTEQEIIRLCIERGTLRPLIQAIRFGAVKFEIHPFCGEFTFGMRSTRGGNIKFEDDRYYYAYLDGKELDYIRVFDNEESLKFVQMLAKINLKLRRNR